MVVVINYQKEKEEELGRTSYSVFIYYHKSLNNRIADLQQQESFEIVSDFAQKHLDELNNSGRGREIEEIIIHHTLNLKEELGLPISEEN